MTKKEFLVELEDMLQREEICLENDNLEDYEEWDSLAKMVIIAYYKKNFAIKIPFNAFENLHSVSDLIILAGKNVHD